MGNRTQSYRTVTLTNAAESANNTETVVCTLAGISTEFDGMTIRFRGWLKATTGTGTTAGLLRIRRDSLTGTSIGEATAETGPFVASKTLDASISADDGPRTLGGATYVMTYQGTGDTSVCTFLAAELSATYF